MEILINVHNFLFQLRIKQLLRTLQIFICLLK